MYFNSYAYVFVQGLRRLDAGVGLFGLKWQVPGESRQRMTIKNRLSFARFDTFACVTRKMDSKGFRCLGEAGEKLYRVWLKLDEGGLDDLF
ncbi:MAG: hypothetical protein ACQET7_15890 [Thermodesulfobacteriota bacterium]